MEFFDSSYPCVICELNKYPREKLEDPDFFLERKNEFYPEEEFGDFAFVCEKCHIEMLEMFNKKK